MDKRVGVLMGGWGEEREVSIKTGEAIAGALERKGHAVTRILAGPGLEQTLRTSRIEVAFLALHGRMGEDGKVQGLLEVMGIPYTGSGVLASALAMRKPFAKKLFRLHNLPCAPGYTVGRDQVVVRPFGTLQISKRTTPGDACERIMTGCAVSFRKRIVCESDTVASRPSGYRVM